MKILDELERLSKEATPGPWVARVNKFSNTAKPRHIWSKSGWGGRFYGVNGDSNAEFTALMRNNIDAMVTLAKCLASVLSEDDMRENFLCYVQGARCIESLEKLK